MDAFLMHMSTALPEFWNLRWRYDDYDRMAAGLPGVGTDLVPPSHRGHEDAGGGSEGLGGLNCSGLQAVDVLCPASDSPGSALGTRAEVVISDDNHVVVSGCCAGSLHGIHQILGGLNLSYQLGHLENNLCVILCSVFYNYFFQ